MCGISGCSSRMALPPGMAGTLQKIAHRGPDDSGYYTTDKVWLGNTRLAIQDLSNRGHQPMRSKDGRYTLVYNGELYNHKALRQELQAKGIAFISDSDTETLLYAYVHYGADCLQKLNGIFAFAVYDEWKEELFIARDPLGVKPLYYYQDDHHFVFASELKALTNLSGLDYSLRPEAFYNYLLFLYNPGNSTPFHNIHKLQAGHFIRIIKGIPETPQPYYQIPFTGTYDTITRKQEWVERTDDALQEAVCTQMISDAPVGFFLSGGLDSSLITAIAHKHFPQKELTCFTINTGAGMSREGFQDDLHFAKIAAQKMGAKLIEVPGSFNIADEFDAMVWHLHEPQADPAALHVLHIAQAAQKMGIKVLLSGAGADDVFSGYRRHQALSFERFRGMIPPALFAMGGAAANAMGMNAMGRRMAKLTFAEGNAINQRIGTHFWMKPEGVRNLFLPDFAHSFSGQYPYAHFQQLLTEIPAEHDPLNQMLYWEMRTFLPQHNLNYTDKMSMAASVETRVPFLDTNLIALSTQMPPELKMNGRETKHILREVAKKYLPPEIIYRQKTGFGAPLRQWIKSDLKPLIRERLLSGSLAQWNIFNPASIQQLVKDNKAGKVDGAYTIFALLSIESWLRQFATAPNAPAQI